MRKSTIRKAARALRSQRRYRAWQKVMTVLSALVVFVTTYMLILPAITMERQAYCGQQEHTHGDACYVPVLLCSQTQEEHVHGEGCYTDALQCGQQQAHTHTDECYITSLACEETGEAHIHEDGCYTRELICGYAGAHTHADGCYQQTTACGLEETQGHSHGDSCYQQTAVCTLSEAEGHSHESGCFAQELICPLQETPGHAHEDGCFQQELVCTLEALPEHIHGDACYGPELTCTKSQEAHVHSEECYEHAWRCVYQQAHNHTDACYTDTLTCTDASLEHVHEAGCYTQEMTCGHVQAHTHTDGCYQQTASCTLDEASGHTHTDTCFQQELVCTQEAVPEHTHTEQCRQRKQELVCTLTAHAHVEECFTEPDTSDKVFTYQSETVSVTVTLPYTSAVPGNAVLRVEPIDRENSQYSELVNQAAQTMESALAYIQLLDISFYTPDGTYYPVDEAAAVTIHIPETRQGGFTVLHYPAAEPAQEPPAETSPAEEAAEEAGIMLLSDMPDETEGTDSDPADPVPAEIQAPVAVENLQVHQDATGMTLSFTTDGFSVYAVVQVYDGMDILSVTEEDMETLLADGQFLILEDEGIYGLTSKDSTLDTNCRAITAVADDMDPWTFVKNEDGYRIYTGQNTYLQLSGNTLTTTNRANNATTFTVTVADGGIRLISGSKCIDHYGTQGFGGWDNKSAANQRFLLARRNTTESPTAVDLDGKSFAIVNTNTNNRTWAMTDEIITESNATGLKGVPIELVSVGEDRYIVYEAGDLTVWTFTAIEDTPGSYYISSGDKYLNLNSDNNVKVSENPQAIRVTTNPRYPGQVKLSSSDTDLNWFGGNGDDTKFSGYSGSDQNNYQTLAQVGGIFYKLNRPNNPNHVPGWVGTAPELASAPVASLTGMTNLMDKPTGSTSELGPAGKAWAKQNPGNTVNPYAGLYRTVSQIPDTVVHNNLELLQNLGCGYKEWRFDGWKYTASDGKVYLLAPSAAVTSQGESITVTPKAIIGDDDAFIPYTGGPITIPSGAILYGHWTEVSAPVFFFINYTGTILDTEGDVTGRSTRNFLNGAAVGRVYYGRTTVGTDGSYANAAHQQISSLFTDVAHLDLDSRETQLVIDAATKYDGTLVGVSGKTEHNETFAEANSRIIMEAVLDWIRNDTSLTIKLSTGNGETMVNNDLATTDNYNVRWYVLKEQKDGWHIDGVVTAVTQTLTVTKSFEGLTSAQAKEILDDYHIDLWIRNNSADRKYMILQDLSQLTAEEKNNLMGQFNDYGSYQEIEGQYTFRYDEGTQTAQWTVHILSQEHVTLQESDYTLDGFTVNAYSMIDGRPVSLSGNKVGYEVSVEENDPTKDVVGGVTKEVAFSNVYTQKGKGSFSLLKKNAATGIVMQNVQFILTDTTGATVQTQSTDATGWVHFLNLEPGTYTLEEQTAPAGFQEAKPLTVVVTESGGTVSVKVLDENGNELARGSPAGQYILENEPEESTVILEKVFENITQEEIAAMTDYHITVSANGGVKHDLKLADAVYKSPDGLRYSWTLTELGNQTLEIKEHHFSSTAHIDVQVSAQVTSGTVTTAPAVTTNKDNTWATTQVTTGAAVTRVTLTNTYTDEFELFLQKVDTITREPLQGAVFDLYGDYDESTNTKKTIRYYLDEDETQVGTLYYIGQTEASNADGLARVAGLRLSHEGKTYAYVLSEISAPTGYVLPKYEIVPYDQVVIVTLQDLENNVFSTSMVNQVEGKTLRVEKESDISGTNAYTMEITISAPTATVRYANRQYTYHIYDSAGTKKSTETVKGVAEVNQEDATDLVESLDTVTFEVELQAGWYVEVENVPVNYSYAVHEPGGYYTSMENANGTGAYYATERTIRGSIVADAVNTVTVSNYANANSAVTSVTVTKVWVSNQEVTRPSVTFRLYTTDGTLVDDKVLSSETGWTYTWSDLPLYNGSGQAQDYYIVEAPVIGYSTSYDRALHALTTGDGSTIWAVHATASHPVVTNTLGSPELPNTGGMGTDLLTLAGMVLMSLSAFMGYTKYKRERRRG